MKKQDNYSLLAPYYDLFINWDARLKKEIPFILGACRELKKGARALDIGCGTGRHLQALQRAGFEVQGLEPSPYLRTQAELSLPEVSVSPAGMESFAGFARTHGPWELITCLGNTLPHLPEAHLPEFCRAIFHALKPGSTAVIHLLGYEKILADRPERLPVKTAVASGASYRFERIYEYQAGHLVFSIEVWKDNLLVGVDREVLYPLRAPVLLKAASAAGFGETHLYGAFDRRIKYSPESDNLVAVLNREAPKS